jgi:aminoglycoside/choline kinase family phosphotransferase
VSAAPIPPTPRAEHPLDFVALAALVERALGARDHAIEPMPGGASTRKYFRISHAGGTAVGMFVPDGAKPEEVAKGAAAPPATWPFLEVRDLLASRGVDVPAMYGEDTAHGWVLLEDLGDETLAAFLVAHPERRVELYVRAVTDLARAQASLAELAPSSVVASRAFDDDLLLWEIHHFREWGLEARGIVLSAEDRTRFDAIAERLARRIASWPRAFVHRDYQSRNLMVGAGSPARPEGERAHTRPSPRLVWIDFQDALLGPRVYDLVALLNDSYQVFDRPFVEARLADYAVARGLAADDRATLAREFDLVTVQRKLKDAGRFVFIDRVKHNPRFLEFVDPTIAKVCASLGRLADDEDMRGLAELLSRVLPQRT